MIKLLYHVTYHPHSLVGALLGQLLGDPGDLVGGLSDRLGAGDQVAFGGPRVLNEINCYNNIILVY